MSHFHRNKLLDRFAKIAFENIVGVNATMSPATDLAKCKSRQIQIVNGLLAPTSNHINAARILRTNTTQQNIERLICRNTTVNRSHSSTTQKSENEHTRPPIQLDLTTLSVRSPNYVIKWYALCCMGSFSLPLRANNTFLVLLLMA